MNFTIKSTKKRRLTPAASSSSFGSDGGNSMFADAGSGAGAGVLASVRALKEEGNRLAEECNFSAALNRWDASLRMIPGELMCQPEVVNESASIHELQAQALMALDQDFRAVQAAHAATNLCPDWGDGWGTLGRSQLNLGEPAMALESFRRALENGPSCPEDVEEDMKQAQQMIPAQADAVSGEAYAAAAFAFREAVVAGTYASAAAEAAPAPVPVASDEPPDPIPPLQRQVT